MKKLFTLVAVVTIGFAANAQYTPKNALKVNPISAIVKTGNISYERAIAKNQSFQLGAFYSAIGLDDLQYRGFGITPEYRLYLGGNAVAMNGGYVAPYARYQQFTIGEKSSDAKAKFETLGGGFVLGYEKASASGFVIDVFPWLSS